MALRTERYSRFSFGRRKLRNQECQYNNEQIAELLKGSTNDAYKNYLNNGEEDQMTVEGFQKSKLRMAVCWSCIILTLGGLRLVLHWWQHWFLFATHSPCSLKQAEKVLITEIYNGKHTVYHVKTIEVVTVDSIRAKIQGDHKDWPENVQMKEGDCTGLSIHISHGVFKEMDCIRRFYCKKLCYVWEPDRGQFLKLRGLDYSVPTSILHQHEGLSAHHQFMRRIVYGDNEIIIPVSGITTLLFLEVLNPFYVFQLFSFCLWFADDYVYYAMAILLMSIFGITMSIVQTRRNQTALRRTVHSCDVAKVVRNDGTTDTVGTELLVPGDILEIPAHGCTMHCDAVLLTGNCILNEAMLTGESVPVTKTPLPSKRDMNYDPKEHARHTLFCGTQVIQTRYFANEKVRAVVVTTGNITAKGGLVRSIMYPPPVDYKFERDSYRFIIMLGGIASIGFIYTVITKFMRGVNPGEIAVESLDLITIAVPPALPAAMTVGRMYAQRRLEQNGIYCISPRTINVSGSIDCVCFDKTGTLTEDGLDMWGVIPTFNKHFQIPLKLVENLANDNFLFGMVTCHSITVIGGNLAGDPLDLKMFEATKWILEEQNCSDENKFDMLFPSVVKPPKLNQLPITEESMPLEIGIVREFPFSSSLQRMSVITRCLRDNHFKVYCKGSPEMISTLCNPSTLPEDFSSVLETYTQQGYRVIAMSYKNLDRKLAYAKVQRVPREKVECDLTFLGLIVLENRLKADTTKVIENLMNAEIRTIMVTGDNILTAISVGKDCGIISPGQGVITVNSAGDQTDCAQLYFTLAGSPSGIVQTPNGITGEYSLMTNSNSIASLETIESCTNTQDIELGFSTDHLKSFSRDSHKIKPSLVPYTNNYRFALTGKTWAVIKEHYPEILPKIVTRGAIFARMSPDEKQALVLELQSLGYYVAMCGDGANDCGALKAAHTGISLSDAESSVASPFTSKNPTIACVPNIIKEGRAALVTSFGIFKYMAAYSLTQFVSVMILYSIDSNLTDIEFLYIDLFLISIFAFFFGKTEAYSGPLVKQTPLISLMSLSPILSLLLQMVVVIVFQVTAFYHLLSEPWYVPFDGANKPHKDSVGCLENYAIFCISGFQYIILAVVYSKGAPYRKSIFSNYGFITSALVMTAFTIYLTLQPAEFLSSFFELVVPPGWDFHVYIVFYGILNFLIAAILEFFVIEYVVFGKLRYKFHNIDKSRRKFLYIENELRLDPKWPPLSDDYTHDIVLNSVQQSPLDFTSFCTEITESPKNIKNDAKWQDDEEIRVSSRNGNVGFEVMLDPSTLKSSREFSVKMNGSPTKNHIDSKTLIDRRNPITMTSILFDTSQNIPLMNGTGISFTNEKISHTETTGLEMADLPCS